MMKISYDEFNELQIQQKIRDYSQDVLHTLICLEQLVKRKDKKQIRDMMNCIHSIENEAIENISKTIKGDQQTMKVNVVLKECNGETNLDWIMEKVKDIFFYDDYVEVEFYHDEEMKEKDITVINRIPKKEIQNIEIWNL